MTPSLSPRRKKAAPTDTTGTRFRKTLVVPVPRVSIAET